MDLLDYAAKLAFTANADPICVTHESVRVDGNLKWLADQLNTRVLVSFVTVLICCYIDVFLSLSDTLSGSQIKLEILEYDRIRNQFPIS